MSISTNNIKMIVREGMQALLRRLRVQRKAAPAHHAVPTGQMIQPLAEVLATEREVRQGDMERGAVLTVFAEALSSNSNYELDWLWLASMLPNSVEREYCLRRALDINPDNIMTQQQLERLAR
jgi:hypothetical protein